MATTCPVDLDTGRLRRILKPGGQFLYGDIIVAGELSESIRRDIDLSTG
jgi:hypothetical protein